MREKKLKRMSEEERTKKSQGGRKERKEKERKEGRVKDSWLIAVFRVKLQFLLFVELGFSTVQPRSSCTSQLGP